VAVAESGVDAGGEGEVNFLAVSSPPSQERISRRRHPAACGRAGTANFRCIRCSSSVSTPQKIVYRRNVLGPGNVCSWWYE